ncbi:serine dehydratase-like isoform X1 [Cuculus canorus]|uniref:serine dehydratase-like isoform X1 n=1 Tax=Cuculus canorus TaxID=55661 RepID=UPI0023AA8A4B|nr:serine dehydratase-like isoform X1 [Cuculus canorus]XP_053938854.1 serine dehydratase-like isoform X1 [Cuculus canorus]
MAAQPSGGEKPFHVVSPTLESLALSKAAGTKVYMKLENVQPTGSFKIRGIGHFCQETAKTGCHHFVCSSGGNAGMAAAYAAKKLGLPITVVVPSTTIPTTVRKLEELGAEVEVSGHVWDEANTRALELARTKGWVSIHPFDHPLVWQGHASLVRELKDSLETKPDAILLAVGGGGLLAGVVAGLHQVGWQDVPIIAAETWGAHSFHAALAAGRLVSLPDITSVATCLGAKTVAARALECAQECQVISQVVEDTEAMRAVEQFLDDERMLVEPACGATLALLYAGWLQRLQREGRLRTPLASVVAVVCGGSSIQAAELRALKSQLGLE